LGAEYYSILGDKDENLTIDESDCELDFFVPPDGRYKYRPKKDRKNTVARDSPRSGCDLLDLDSYPSRTFDTSASGALSEYEANLKIFAIHV